MGVITAARNAPGRVSGRAQQTSELSDLLTRARLVTLTGAPGIGKTWLAREVAGRHADRAWLVELAPVGDAGGVARAVASMLSVQEAAGRSLIDVLAARLSGQPALLVLDNCEHVLDSCAGLIGALLDACPLLRVLATSREPLTAAGEVVWPVPPLSLPDEHEAVESPERLLDYEAVALFVDRAAAAQPGFALTSYVAPQVVEICRRLDGMPLALALAAARVRDLTPAEIAARLDDRFGLLTGGSDGPPRHETLELALDWSHALLSAPEQALLRRLSVFSGGFGLEAVEAVCTDGGLPAARVRPQLDRLVAKSLVTMTSGDAPQPRYALLETIRAYAAERLVLAGETQTLREAHARYHLELAERAEPELAGADQRTWLDRLELERPNLLAAIDWCLSHGRGDWALRHGVALVLFWRVRCHFSEGRDLLRAALAAAPDSAKELKARGLWGAGFLGAMAGDGDSATDAVRSSLAIFEELGDPGGQARALLVLGNSRQHRGDPDALSLLERSAELAREAGDAWCEAHALGCAGLEQSELGDHDAAKALLEECIEVARAAQDRQGLRFGLFGLAAVALSQGDHGAAEPVLLETLAVADELGEPYTRATVLFQLGEVAAFRRDFPRARASLDEALSLLREVKPHDLAPSLAVRARVAAAEGDRTLARELLDEAVALARAGDPRAHSILNEHAEFVAADGDHAAARRLFEEALELAGEAGAPLQTADSLCGLGNLAAAEGDAKRAVLLHRQALELHGEVDHPIRIAHSLWALARLAGQAGRGERAARLLGAAQALRESVGHALSRQHAARWDSELAAVADTMPARAMRTALDEGSAMSVEEAIAYARNGRSRAGGSDGWALLTEAERQVAGLVAQGMTNREIAETLFISRGTVKAHLSRVYAKLGLVRRTELAREVSRRA